MKRAVLPFAATVLVALAPGAAVAQRALPPTSPGAVAVRWSLPMSHVRRQVPSWSATDLSLAGGFLTLLWVDASQTRSLARKNWRGFSEANPLLGRKPSEGQVNTYTALAAVTTLGIAQALQPKARRWWLGAAVALQAFTVYHSTAHLGVSFSVR
ncbi:MAG TPA: hypothetical protein VGQ29_03840 [Gemmatimonadales bacterium]|jgi:hypothetical protein|nr:hypothetical protein [Gemmatimonadales bacterium]